MSAMVGGLIDTTERIRRETGDEIRSILFRKATRREANFLFENL
jgi:hypothetical protein